jgi:hypothetical protein
LNPPIFCFKGGLGHFGSIPVLYTRRTRRSEIDAASIFFPEMAFFAAAGGIGSNIKCGNDVCRIRYNPYSACPSLDPSPGGKAVPDSFPGETRTGEMLQASILTNLVCTVLSAMITASWFACRGQSASPFPLPTLVCVGFDLCPA